MIENENAIVKMSDRLPEGLHRAARILLAGLCSMLVAAGCAATTSAPAPPPSAGMPTAASAPASPDAPSALERELLGLLNEWRREQGLARVPMSRSLSRVARLHAADLDRHGLDPTCGMHSWSTDGPWTPCCYGNAHANPSCMWNKPRELTRYEGVGFEIGYWYSAGVRPSLALQSWKSSQAHGAVVRNSGAWKSRVWRAAGVGIVGQFAVVWFGEETDPAGNWD